jgi:hypothetical protein
MTTDDLRKELSPPGEMIKVNGRKVHVQRSILPLFVIATLSPALSGVLSLRFSRNLP